jgi:HPt (histidine-containing phosphotransfer) domain-containing protein
MPGHCHPETPDMAALELPSAALTPADLDAPARRSPPRPLLSLTSTLAELPGWTVVLAAGSRAKRLAELFHEQPELPGVLLAEGDEVRSAISRRYYLDMVGRYCGMDLYHARPIRLMMDRFEQLGGALVLPSSLAIREAVRRGLDRARELVYEPLVVYRDEPGRPGPRVRLVDFEDLLLADSHLSTRVNAQMRQILETVREGLLMIAPDGTVADERSTSVARILGLDLPGGSNLFATLERLLGPARCQLARDYVGILCRPQVIEELVGKLNPLETVELATPTGGPRIVSFRFYRSFEDGAIRRLLVRLEDITQAELASRELAAARQANEERVALALALPELEPAALGRFLERLARCLEYRGALAAAALARELHALKGEAAMLGLLPFRATLHQLEDALARPNAEPWRAPELFERLAHLRQETLDLAERAGRLARSLTARPAGPQAPTADDLSGLGQRLVRFVEELGRELGRPATLALRLDAPTLAAPHLELLEGVLPQLARNALVHGLEAPARRRELGKPAVGTLQLALRRHATSGGLEVVLQDDGAGLDLERLAARARELGLPGSTPAELLELPFRTGFSTAAQVDDHAGRGVGLDLVRSRIVAAGGRVALHSAPGRFCAAQILLPASEERP